MNKKLEELLVEMEVFGRENDSINKDKELRMRNISRTTAELLAFLIKISKTTEVLEIGTSNGYSSIWLADALSKTNGHLTTIEYLSSKVKLAEKNFKKAGLSNIELIHGDAGAFINKCPSDRFELILLDSDRKEYVSWWEDLVKVVSPVGTIVVDNAISHQDELSDFVQIVKKTPNCRSFLLPFDSGVYIISFNE